MTTDAGIADPRFNIQHLLTYKIPAHDLVDHDRLSLLWDGFRTRHDFKHRETADCSDRHRYSHVLDALKREEGEHIMQRTLVAAEWSRLMAGRNSSTTDERTLNECFSQIPPKTKAVEGESDCIKEAYPPYYPQPKLRVDMSALTEPNEVDFTKTDEAVLYVPMGFCPSKYYLGHIGGDYIFRYDSAGNGYGYASRQRFVFDGVVPRPQREYLMRFRMSVLPRVVDMIIGILAFLPASPDFIHPNLRVIRGTVDSLSVADILYLVGIWTAKFCDPATGEYRLPECLRLTGCLVEELGWLWERLDCLRVFGHLIELQSLVEKATGQSTATLSALWDERLAFEGRRILFDERKYGDEVLVYKLCSGMDSESLCTSIHEFYEVFNEDNYHLTRHSRIPAFSILSGALNAAKRITITRQQAIQSQALAEPVPAVQDEILAVQNGSEPLVNPLTRKRRREQEDEGGSVEGASYRGACSGGAFGSCRGGRSVHNPRQSRGRASAHQMSLRAFR